MPDTRLQRTMLFLAMGGGGLFLAALVLCDLIPPPSPGNSAQFWVSFWSKDVQLTRLGVICGLLVPVGTIPLYVLIFQQLRRIEGAAALAYVQLIAGVYALVPGTTIPFLAWSPLVFRPDALEPRLTQALSDLGMFSFFLPWPAIIQFVAFGFAIFMDQQEKVFPRWFGYLNLWVALIAIPGGTILFFKGGPMAWNGLLPWWVALAALVAWGAPFFVVMFRAISSQEAEQVATEVEGAAVGRSA